MFRFDDGWWVYYMASSMTFTYWTCLHYVQLWGWNVKMVTGNCN